MIEINQFSPADTDEIVALVLHCQNDGTRPLMGVADQPDVLDIAHLYIDKGGNFWVAKHEGRVAGTIGLMNKGGGVGILKKFFVYEPFRGAPHHLGLRLYDVLLDFARRHGFKTIILDTPTNTDRAHRFYARAGFVQIEKSALPVEYDYPYDDSHFFRLDL